jgi:uncharacterized RDD family membrane protein YckC
VRRARGDARYPDAVPASELGFETASWGRRALAIFVDWIASTLVVIAVVGWDDYQEIGGNQSGLFVLAVFVLESALFIALLGGSFGQVATRLRVIDVNGAGGNVTLLRSLGRQVLIALVIPPLVFRADGRGLHDLMAGSAVVTVDQWRHLTGRDAVRSGA